MYGETASIRSMAWIGTGLSPHVRGNRLPPARPVPTPGSIPACTGKPRTDLRRHQDPEVYPRMYGETSGMMTVVEQ